MLSARDLDYLEDPTRIGFVGSFVAITFAQHAGATLTTEDLTPRAMRMVFADKADTEADRALAIGHIDCATNMIMRTMSPAIESATPRSSKKISDACSSLFTIGPRIKARGPCSEIARIPRASGCAAYSYARRQPYQAIDCPRSTDIVGEAFARYASIARLAIIIGRRSPDRIWSSMNRTRNSVDASASCSLPDFSKKPQAMLNESSTTLNSYIT